MLTRQNADGSSTTPNGLRLVKFDGSPTLSLFRALILDASLEDAIADLPPCIPNAGRMVWVKRIDEPGSVFTATVVPDGTDTIEGETEIELTVQYDGILLLAGPNGIWLVVARVGV